jgi:hypothetical protein
MSRHPANGEVPHLKNVRVHGGDNVVEEVRLSGEELLGGIAHYLLGLLGVLGSNAVPKVVFTQAIIQYVLEMAIGLHYPLDFVNNPKYKLLRFIQITKFFCKKKRALAFNRDRCCHLALCLQLILFHWKRM